MVVFHVSTSGGAHQHGRQTSPCSKVPRLSPRHGTGEGRVAGAEKSGTGELLGLARTRTLKVQARYVNVPVAVGPHWQKCAGGWESCEDQHASTQVHKHQSTQAHTHPRQATDVASSPLPATPARLCTRLSSLFEPPPSGSSCPRSAHTRIRSPSRRSCIHSRAPPMPAGAALETQAMQMEAA